MIQFLFDRDSQNMFNQQLRTYLSQKCITSRDVKQVEEWSIVDGKE